MLCLSPSTASCLSAFCASCCSSESSPPAAGRLSTSKEGLRRQTRPISFKTICTRRKFTREKQSHASCYSFFLVGRIGWKMNVRHFRLFEKRKRVFRGSHAEGFADRRVRVLSEVLCSQPCRPRAIRLLLIGLLKQRSSSDRTSETFGALRGARASSSLSTTGGASASLSWRTCRGTFWPAS